jgi:uncharacterized membrane-anchored protein
MNKPTTPLGRTVLKYVIVALLPLGILVSQPVAYFTILSFGEPVLLETRPVDPRDFLRGDYVELDYSISSLPDELMPEGWQENERSKTIYVTLVKNRLGVGSIGRISFSPPSGELYLRGSFLSRWRGDLTCDYGLGVCFVPEGEGVELERKVREAKVLADVRVLWGRGVIKGLKIVESDDAGSEPGDDGDSGGIMMPAGQDPGGEGLDASKGAGDPDALEGGAPPAERSSD